MQGCSRVKKIEGPAFSFAPEIGGVKLSDYISSIKQLKKQLVLLH